ncbi:hypothetical protein [Leptolyngbya sp. FACHB-261]|nr:hypothetical protein [Leptolyngbya sp. FACHB-261]MBD2104367.1 hypothetical protein [Leptolyngbya sp. FACHB-261]
MFLNPFLDQIYSLYILSFAQSYECSEIIPSPNNPGQKMCVLTRYV